MNQPTEPGHPRQDHLDNPGSDRSQIGPAGPDDHGRPYPSPPNQYLPGHGAPGAPTPEPTGQAAPDWGVNPETTYRGPESQPSQNYSWQPSSASAPPQPGFQHPPQGSVDPQRPPFQQPGGTPYPPPPYPPPAMLPMVQGPPTGYASWGKRVGAYLIDFIPGLLFSVIILIGYVLLIIGAVSSVQTGGRFEPDPTTIAVWLIVVGVLWVVTIVWNIINRWIKGGRTGQSLGKRVTKIMLVSEQTGQPIGAGNAFLRDLLHVLDGAAYIGYLWPLWDDKRQTFSDKLMRTIVINRPESTTPGSTG